jgi:hypothetical protein
MFEQIMFQGKLLALIISHNFKENGLRFFTSDDLSQQLAFMRYPAGKSIIAHVHNPVERRVEYTRKPETSSFWQAEDMDLRYSKKSR